MHATSRSSQGRLQDELPRTIARRSCGWPGLIWYGLNGSRYMRAGLIASLSLFLGAIGPNPTQARDPEDAPQITSDSQRDSEQLFLQAERSVVKLYGAGGVRGLESYQTGVVIGDGTLIVTSWSTVLDVDKVRVVTFDGRRLDATLAGVDLQCELALLRVSNSGLVGFPLDSQGTVKIGQRVFALTNLYGIAAGNEACSAQKGVVMAIAPLTSRSGALKTLYQGKVIVVDVMTNNPGATGGALIDLSGRLVGIIGKELRDEQSGIWLNYALPIDVVKNSVDRMLSGESSALNANVSTVAEPHRLKDLGLALIPDVLPKTPAFVDWVKPESVASRSGLLSNDLILLVNETRVDSRKSLERLLATINRSDSFSLLVQRGQDLVRIQVRP
ncbi:MAG: S1C family serine protease [Planctomycetota bacterium]